MGRGPRLLALWLYVANENVLAPQCRVRCIHRTVDHTDSDPGPAALRQTVPPNHGSGTAETPGWRALPIRIAGGRSITAALILGCGVNVVQIDYQSPELSV